MSGYVLTSLHPHITLAMPDKAFGGHLEPGTTVCVLPDGLDLSKLDDKNYR